MFVVPSTSTMHLILLAMWITIQLRQSKGDGEASGQPDSNYSMVTCNFERNSFCGWQNHLNFNDGWKIANSSGNSYAVLAVRFGFNFTRSMGSPWLKALHGYTCWLQFSYYIELNNRCSLTVIWQSEPNRTRIPIWSTTNEPDVLFFKTIEVKMECTDVRYRIIFQGERLGNNKCGNNYTAIAVDEIAYYIDRTSTIVTKTSLRISSLSTTVKTSLPTASTALSLLSQISGAVSSTPEVTSWSSRSSVKKGVNDNATFTGSEAEGSKKGLDTASLVGIIVGVMAVFISGAIFIIILVCLRRKKGKESNHRLTQCSKKRANLAVGDVPQAATNSPCEIDEGRISSANSQYEIPAGRVSSTNSSYAEFHEAQTSGNGCDNVNLEGKYTDMDHVYSKIDDNYSELSSNTTNRINDDTDYYSPLNQKCYYLTVIEPDVNN